ncbi:MAG TPA: F0F1 ATP synthase subunit A [Candidatus Acidoferrum sp.]|nr:F0F1 ATP synthase subunit A [Candidatus Acidoferrum sp.]
MSLTFFAATPQISIAPETLFTLGPLPITNSLLLGLVGFATVLGLFFATTHLIKKGSRSRFMYAIVWLFEILLGMCEEVLGSREKARKVMPLAATLFIAILVNNWLGLLPLVGSITYNGHPLLRGFDADLNSTFALAIISMTAVQIWAIKTHGFFGNIGRYIHNPLKDPMRAFEGFLEIVAEFSRLVALSMRLFGNVLGGEVLLAVIGFISSYGAPLALPAFYVLELFVGGVQAYVFFMLTVVFIAIGSSVHEPVHATPALPNILETKPDVAKPKTSTS